MRQTQKRIRPKRPGRYKPIKRRPIKYGGAPTMRYKPHPGERTLPKRRPPKPEGYKRLFKTSPDRPTPKAPLRYKHKREISIDPILLLLLAALAAIVGAAVWLLLYLIR